MSDPLLARIEAELAVVEEAIRAERAKVAAGPAKWGEQWAGQRAGAMTRLYGLRERRHVLKLLDASPDRQFFGKTRIHGLVGRNGKRIKTYRRKGQVRIADWSEVSDAGGKLRAQLGDIKSASEFQKSVGQLKTGNLVDPAFRATSEIGKQHAKEAAIIAEAKRLNAKILLRAKNILTGEVIEFEVSPWSIQKSSVVAYDFIHESRLPLPRSSVYRREFPKPRAPKVPAGAEARRKAKVTSGPRTMFEEIRSPGGVTRTTITTTAEPRAAKAAANGHAAGKPERKPPLPPKRYAGTPEPELPSTPAGSAAGAGDAARGVGDPKSAGGRLTRLLRGTRKVAARAAERVLVPAQIWLEAESRAQGMAADLREDVARLGEANALRLAQKKRAALADPEVTAAMEARPFANWVYEIRKLRRWEVDRTNGAPRYSSEKILDVSVKEGSEREAFLIDNDFDRREQVWLTRKRVNTETRTEGQQLVADDKPLRTIDLPSHGAPQGKRRAQVINDYVDYAARFRARKNRYDEALRDYRYELCAAGRTDLFSEGEVEICRWQQYFDEQKRSRGTGRNARFGTSGTTLNAKELKRIQEWIGETRSTRE